MFVIMILTVALRLKTYLHLDLSLPPESERDTVIGEYLSPSFFIIGCVH
jgi:hypothetical protein